MENLYNKISVLIKSEEELSDFENIIKENYSDLIHRFNLLKTDLLAMDGLNEKYTICFYIFNDILECSVGLDYLNMINDFKNNMNYKCLELKDIL